MKLLEEAGIYVVMVSKLLVVRTEIWTDIRQTGCLDPISLHLTNDSLPVIQHC